MYDSNGKNKLVDVLAATIANLAAAVVTGFGLVLGGYSAIAVLRLFIS